LATKTQASSEARFSEDPEENARLCIDIAPDGCVDCGDFHLRSVLRRLSSRPQDKIGDMTEFSAMTGQALSQLHGVVPEIRVGIVGSTDSGILATLMTVAEKIGGVPLVTSLKVTLMDQCATPLEICKAFAIRNNITLETVQGDFLGVSLAREFDLILMHGVLPFFPITERNRYLTHIAKWLSRDGVLLSSTHLGAKPYPNTDKIRTATAIENLAHYAALPTSDIDDETVAMLVRRLEASRGRSTTARTVFADLQEATRVYEAAGLQILHANTVQIDGGGEAKMHRKYKTRAIVMCAAKS
jgi:hypothetical protein